MLLEDYKQKYINKINNQPIRTDYINNYKPRFATKYINGKEKQNRAVYKWLILIHYNDILEKHQIFITEETERQLLKRVKSLSYDKKYQIKYLNVYRFLTADQLDNYGEFTYREKNIYFERKNKIERNK